MSPLLLTVLLACGHTMDLSECATESSLDATVTLLYRDKTVIAHTDGTTTVIDADGHVVLDHATPEVLADSDPQQVEDLMRTIAISE